jgi:hypothetical protein
MQAGYRVVDRPLYIKAAPTCHGPLGKCQLQEMWSGGASILPYILLMPSTALAGYRLAIIDSAWLEPIDFRRVSIKLVLDL